MLCIPYKITQNLHNINAFFFLSFFQTVLTRINTMTNMAYKDDSTIMAWELMNEPRCQSDYSGKMINVIISICYVLNNCLFSSKIFYEKFMYMHVCT